MAKNVTSGRLGGRPAASD